jgi:hypothetical protein
MWVYAVAMHVFGLFVITIENQNKSFLKHTNYSPDDGQSGRNMQRDLQQREEEK